MKKKVLAIVMLFAMMFTITACSQKSEGALIIDVPAGFVYDSYSYCYLGPNYPEELANISYYSYENDGTFGTLTRRSVETVLEDTLSASYWEDIDVTISRWEKTRIDGYKALVYTYEFECDGVWYEQTQVAINGKDYIHYVTFTDYVDSFYRDEFDECIRNMRFE